MVSNQLKVKISESAPMKKNGLSAGIRNDAIREQVSAKGRFG
jgi:hypothetical protein